MDDCCKLSIAVHFSELYTIYPISFDNFYIPSKLDFFMRLFLLTFFLSFFTRVLAQSITPVHLKSGDYFPTSIEKTTLQAREHFVIIQFKTLPNTDDFYTKT